MVGIPDNMNSREDWLNAYQYAINNGGSKALRARLEALGATKTMLVLKAGVKKTAEEQTPDDFEAKTDPNSAFALSGLTDDEIASMIGNL